MKLDEQSFLAAVCEVIYDRGLDYIYAVRRTIDGADTLQCLYWYEDAPSCLFGEVFYRMGVPAATIAGFDRGCACLSDILAGFGLSVPVQLASDEAQETQDNGAPYREVLRVFKEGLAGAS